LETLYNNTIGLDNYSELIVIQAMVINNNKTLLFLITYKLTTDVLLIIDLSVNKFLANKNK